MVTDRPQRLALGQAQIPIAKNQLTTAELSRKGQQIAKAVLASKGLTYLSPQLSAIATCLAYRDLADQLEQEQGAIEQWTKFGPGLSLSNTARWLTGQPVTASVHHAFCLAIAELGNILFDPQAMSAPDPKRYFPQLYKENQQRIVALAQGTSFCRTLLDNDWAQGPSWKVSAEALLIEPALYPIAYKIYARARNSVHQVGVVVFTTTGALQSLVDSRLYIWSGREIKNGKKIIRTLRIKGDVEAQLQTLLNNQVGHIQAV